MEIITRTSVGGVGIALALTTVLGCAPKGTETEGIEVRGTDIVAIPVSTESESALLLFYQGEYLLDVGRFVQAREMFLDAVAEDPGFTRAYLELSNSALSFQEFQEALDNAVANLESTNAAEKLMVEINRTFLSNDSERGLELADELVERYPNSPRAAVILAAMQANQNDNERARATYRRAREIDPEFPAALFGLANNYLFGEPKDFAAAEETAQTFIGMFPYEAKGYELLGDIKRAQLDLEAALAAYEQAAEGDPTLAVAHHKIGHVNTFLGNYEEARAAYDLGIETAVPESKASTAIFKTFASIYAGDIPGALAELEAVTDQIEALGTPAEQVKGLQVFALNSYATAALHAGLLDRAAVAVARRNELQMAIADDVGTDDARRLQEADCQMWDGLVAAYEGDADGAAAHAAQIAALVEGDENPRKMEAYHWVLGRSALEAEDWDAALEHLRQADHANNMYIRYHLALAEETLGNTEQAKELFAEVAGYNFNTVGFALVRDDAKRRASG